jgi:inosine-uridine nucleoside N-ribohydrolase
MPSQIAKGVYQMGRSIILDTDIAGDIDDSWALGLALASPALDIKLVVSCLDDTTHRAAVMAKFLEQTGRTDVPVGIGLRTSDKIYNLRPWLGDYTLGDYPGTVYADGVQAIVDTIMQSSEPVTIIAEGPMTNIAAALEREPRIAEKCEIIATMGSIYQGHSLDDIHKDSDYNIRANIPAARQVLAAPWKITAVPLDVTAHLVIGDDNYQKLLAVRASNPIVKTILENFDCWMEENNCTYYKTHSTALYDLAAVYMAEMGDYNLITEDLYLTIDDGGYTNIDEKAGRLCHCAVYWRYIDMFYKFITERLCGER